MPGCTKYLELTHPESGAYIRHTLGRKIVRTGRLSPSPRSSPNPVQRIRAGSVTRRIRTFENTKPSSPEGWQLSETVPWAMEYLSHALSDQSHTTGGTALLRGLSRARALGRSRRLPGAVFGWSLAYHTQRDLRGCLRSHREAGELGPGNANYTLAAQFAAGGSSKAELTCHQCSEHLAIGRLRGEDVRASCRTRRSFVAEDLNQLVSLTRAVPWSKPS